MFRVLTIAREYGSGGAAMGGRVSERLGWTLLDKAFIENIARAAKVDPQLARQLDERTDTWLERLGRQGFWRGAFEGIAVGSPPDFFDAETMSALAQSMIEEAYQRGNCVIVGRGAQCVLRKRKDVFHVFIHAPWAKESHASSSEFRAKRTSMSLSGRRIASVPTISGLTMGATGWIRTSTI